MRTTVTLPDGLVKQAKAMSGKSRLSEALAVSLEEYFRLKKRLALLDDLFDHAVPHNFKRIKAQRKGRKWSS
jgi:hypothetical protein